MLARVLVVDDDRYVRSLLKEYLVGEGYAVEVAETGAAAPAMARERSPDAVLMDVNRRAASMDVPSCARSDATSP